MVGLEEWLPLASAGTETGLSIAQVQLDLCCSRGLPEPRLAVKLVSSMAISERLLEILVCPLCKAKVVLKEDGSGLKCVSCHRVYPVRDDIPIMMVDQATIEA
jgi:uncharacterized protein YbaR (Trm112 family)